MKEKPDVDLDEIFEEIEDFNNKKESENLSEGDFLWFLEFVKRFFPY